MKKCLLIIMMILWVAVALPMTTLAATDVSLLVSTMDTMEQVKEHQKTTVSDLQTAIGRAFFEDQGQAFWGLMLGSKGLLVYRPSSASDEIYYWEFNKEMASYEQHLYVTINVYAIAELFNIECWYISNQGVLVYSPILGDYNSNEKGRNQII